MNDLPKTLPAFFWHFIKPYRLYFFGMIAFALIWAVNVSITPYVMKIIIDLIVAEQHNLTVVFDKAFPYMCLYVSLFILDTFNFRFYELLLIKMLPSVQKDIWASMFAYLKKHSHNYFQNHFAGSLSNKISDMTNGFKMLLIEGIDIVLAHTLLFLIATATMFIVNPIFSFILIGWGILFLSLAICFSKTTQGYAQVLSEFRSSLTGKTVDSITNVLNTRLFSRDQYENQFLDQTLQKTVKQEKRLIWHILKIRTVLDSTMILFLAGMLWALVALYQRGMVTAGDFAFVIMLSFSVLRAVWFLAARFVHLAVEVGKCTQALSIITPEHEIKDASDAKPLDIKQGEIVFDRVSFHYEKGNRIFTDNSVVIPGGQKVGLVGFSGSGKTTFVNLILRYYDVQSGRILIDGQDIAKVKQESLREKISMIPQDTSLFHRSLFDNIHYGKLEASEDEVIEAAKKAHCHDFIESMADGYQAIVGERGIKLSGGQRQRIAIARAVLKNAPLLILDEATSSLDSVTEKQIQESLKELMKNRTTIVVAHRLSTLSDMDRILVFKQGRIIEDGTHEELLNCDGHYFRLWEMQIGGYLPDDEEQV